MRYTLRKTFSLIALPLFSFFSATAVALAAATDEFVPLAPIPGVIQEGLGFQQFLSGAFTLGVIVAAFLAVIMIVVGGLEYMMSEAVTSKEDAKDRITSAVLGLLLILFSYILLYTINPDIITLDIFNNTQ